MLVYLVRYVHRVLCNITKALHCLYETISSTTIVTACLLLWCDCV